MSKDYVNILFLLAFRSAGLKCTLAKIHRISFKVLPIF